MRDTSAPASYDLAVIGAGIAGLNALWSAADHLPKGARVLLVDRGEGPGGMWRHTYPFVRLHQPHGSFTVGSLGWDWDRPAGYLARGDEVVRHLERCHTEVQTRLPHEARFATEATGIAEEEEAVRLTLRDATGETEVRAARVIHAAGLDVPRIAPLHLSSEAVASITPGTLHAAPETAPAYVVGGGKTGMDTCLALIEATPGRKVVLLNGRGTLFADRDLTLPEGIARAWRGHLVLPTFRKIALRFDGTNASEVFAHYRDTYSIALPQGGEQFLYALLSGSERDRIAAGLAEVVPDYLEDVVDGAEGPELVLRSGARRAIEPGAAIVNCTGHLLRHARPYTPFLSPGGRVLTISSRSAAHFLSSVGGYFLPHLFLTDRLRDAGLWEIDLDALHAIDPRLLYAAATTLTFHNTVALIAALPFSVLDACALDLDRWFPLHRRLTALVDVKLNRARYLAHCRAALARVARDHGVVCRAIGDGAAAPVPTAA